MERVIRKPADSARAAQRKVTRNAARSGFAERIDNSPMMVAQRKKLDSLFGGAVQRVEDEEPLQGKFETAQRMEEEEPIQGKSEAASPAQFKEKAAKPNNTGLPDNLKSGIESLSGLSMDNVRVHYNSSQPAQLNAHAYTQGSDIHVAPGQEQHLPHEAWHVVQQAQGRVRPTKQMKHGVAVNNDTSLGRGADVMGSRALQANVDTMGWAYGASEHQDKVPVQRVKIGPYQIETTTAPRDVVLHFLQDMSAEALKKALDAMQAENNPRNVEYIQICKKKLVLHEDMQDIDSRSKKDGGIWTKATVLLESDIIFKTDPVAAGGHGYSDEYSSDERSDERDISARDSEVGTLYILGQRLREYVTEKPPAPGTRLEVFITGNIGPCDGCKERLDKFWNEFLSWMRRRQINFKMRVNYTTRPYDTTRNHHPTTYGYRNDRRYYGGPNYTHMWGY